jgi:ABC-type antimicrobial peptide transport system permease subunit
MQHKTYNDVKATHEAMPFPIGGELTDRFGNDFKYVVISSWVGDHILSFNENNLTLSGAYMDYEAPNLLSLKMLQGSMDGLRKPASILLSTSSADAIFGGVDPMGKSLRIDNSMDVMVTGIYEDLPDNSRFNDLSFIAPWDLYMSSQEWLINERASPHWDQNSFMVLAQLVDHADIQQVSEKIKKIKYDKVNEYEKTFDPEIFLHPMKDWHLRSNWVNGVKADGRIQYVWMFGLIGVFVLILACINFMNLSTAHSEGRFREVGIRKSMGSQRSQLILQFFSESFMVVVLAFMVACVLTNLLIPYFNDLADSRLIFPLTNPWFWQISVGFMLMSGFLAGSYPALYLSSFRPIKALRNTFRAGSSARLFRRALIMVQFTVSISLIAGTVIVEKQIQFSKNRPLGYDDNGIIMIEINSPDQYGKYQALRNKMIGTGAITEMTESSSPLTDIWNGNGGFSWEGKDPSLQSNFSMVWVTPQYGKTVGWEIVQGRDLSPDISSDSNAFVVNEAAVAFMGIEEPIGKTVRWGDRDFEIVGVVRDMLMQSPYKPVDQTIFKIDDDEHANWMILKLNPAKGIAESLAIVESIYRELIPSVPFEYKFADQEHGQKFKTEERVGKLSSVFAVLAIIVSCLGLFGMASFMAEQREKEIGVRKVLGATVFSLWKMLTSEFIVLVIVSCLMATPITFYFLSGWLDNYEYRTGFSWSAFLFSGVAAVIITLCTVSYHAIKTALRNPVNSLKAE